MAATIRNPWKNAKTSREKYDREVSRLRSVIAHAESVLAWQISEDYEPQAENSRAELRKLNAKLAKLIEA